MDHIICQTKHLISIMFFLWYVLCLSQVFPVQNIIVNFPTRCQVDLKVPVVVRLEGTNVDQGKRILKVRAVDDSGAWFLVYMFWLCFVVWKHTCLLVIFIFIFAGKWNDFDHCRRSWWCGRESCKSIRQITIVYQSEVSFFHWYKMSSALLRISDWGRSRELQTFWSGVILA